MLFDSPTKEEWRDLDAIYPFGKLEVFEKAFQYTAHADGSIEKFIVSQEIFTWVLHLQNRLIQTHWTYLLLMFFFNKGIPDDEWFISPGKKGQSIEYFPHFEEKDHLVKTQFNYYVDVFYYKLFSAWDTLGHLLNVMHELNIERASFDKSVKGLRTVKPNLYHKLWKIMNSPDFKKMRKFRHDVTHNHLLGHIGPSVKKVSPSHTTFGGGTYTPSAEIKENVIKSLDLFVATLEAIKEQSAADNPN